MTAIDAGSRARDVTVYAGGLVAVAEFDGDAPPPPGGARTRGTRRGRGASGTGLPLLPPTRHECMA
jgi:hypothetical protein